MAKCQVCAFENEEGAEYCEECGVKMGAAPTVQQPAPVPPPAEPPAESPDVPQAHVETPPQPPARPELFSLGPSEAGESKPAQTAVPCPSCGNEIPEQSRFCPRCGSRTDSAAAPADASAPSKCSSCSSDVEPGALFCSGCGTRVSAGEAISVPGRPKPKGEVIRLRVVAGKEKDKIYEIEKTEVRIGRLSENDIPMETDGYVSGKHTRISRQGNDFFVEDLGSTNGTFLKVRKQTRLVPGDEIKVGQSIFRLE
ncbi:MAG: zinc ribbon domain-containing protein [Candidatus Riflebacteria bacterium]|nr:zinc ribbon domain-containing protein [Candidatus Riflebacteria bacterium]